MLRPEKVELLPADAVAGVAGTVRELVYVGDFTRYRVAVDGATLTAKVANARGSFRPALDQGVRLLWGLGDECIIPLSA